MQPRGQLWFELEKICRDFQEYSGLEKKEAQEVLVIVLTNMLAEQKANLGKLAAGESSGAAGGPSGLADPTGAPG